MVFGDIKFGKINQTNMDKKLQYIISQFNIHEKDVEIKPLGEGFINDTFLVRIGQEKLPGYILQRKNKKIFVDVPGMMDNISKVIKHLKAKILNSGGDETREAMTIISAKDGKLYYRDDEGEYWTTCLFIRDNITYETASTPALAYAGGKGIGKFQAMLADMNETLIDILPGFHKMKFRFEKWDSVLGKDPVGRKKDLNDEISWIESRREEMLKFWKLFENGELPARVTHNDTKINNILFDKDGEVLCVIDLDTVLNSTALNDYGDAIRSYTNTGLEDDKKLENVSLDLEIFEAYTKGYLSEASSFLNQTELSYLAFSAKYITFEQVLRFLMDYIDGDNYYKIKYHNHNLVRTHAQYKLLTSMEDNFERMQQIVKQSISK